MDLPKLLADSGALLTGHFRLSSGLHSRSYVQCAKLLEHPAHALAVGKALAGKLGSYEPGLIVAPALGGMIIGFTVATALDRPMLFTERKDGAMTLRRGFEISQGSRVAIVEDVVTTGKSTRETAVVVEEQGGRVVAIASILNRSGKMNPFDLPYLNLMELDFENYDEGFCPLCQEGLPLTAPGSRYSQKAAGDS